MTARWPLRQASVSSPTNVETDHGRHPLFCLPEAGVSRAEGARLFVAWGRANPQDLSEVPVDGLMGFAVATWPCKPAKH
jgi:hypothetical protein